MTRRAGSAPGSGQPSDKLALDPAQVANARIIVGVAVGLRLPTRAVVVALAAARQESGLHNLNYGDRDSLGLFQMRPPMGWGSPTQILNPVYAATTFYRHLTAIAGWVNMPVTVAAHAVERSAYPDAYAQWATLAIALAAALLNHGAATVTCATEGPAPAAGDASGHWPAQRMNADGLTPRTAYVKDMTERTFGERDIGGYCPGGCRTGLIPGWDHYTGHAIDVMILPCTDPTRVAKGWRIADWLVTNAQPLAIKYIIYRDRQPGSS